MKTAEELKFLATNLHSLYEVYSREVNWVTQKECQVAFDELPEENKKVMLKMAEYVFGLMEQYAREYARSIQLSDEEIKEMFTEVMPLRPKDRKMVNWDSFESARKYKQQILNKL